MSIEDIRKQTKKQDGTVEKLQKEIEQLEEKSVVDVCAKFNNELSIEVNESGVWIGNEDPEGEDEQFRIMDKTAKLLRDHLCELYPREE